MTRHTALCASRRLTAWRSAPPWQRTSSASGLTRRSIPGTGISSNCSEPLGRPPAVTSGGIRDPDSRRELLEQGPGDRTRKNSLVEGLLRRSRTMQSGWRCENTAKSLSQSQSCHVCGGPHYQKFCRVAPEPTPFSKKMIARLLSENPGKARPPAEETPQYAVYGDRPVRPGSSTNVGEYMAEFHFGNPTLMNSEQRRKLMEQLAQAEHEEHERQLEERG